MRNANETTKYPTLTTRRDAETAGYSKTGYTTDQSMLGEIMRDFNNAGYSVVFVETKNCYHYFTKLCANLD